MVPGIATMTILPWHRGSVVHTWPVTAVCEYTGSVNIINIPANYILATNRPVSSKFLGCKLTPSLYSSIVSFKKIYHTVNRL